MYSLIARDSSLSKAQVKEVKELFGLETMEEIYIKTSGDLDLKTSLMTLGATDFFTKEIDDAILEGKADIAIHSAKDLPAILREGLETIAMTKGVDPRDALVMKEGYAFQNLPKGALIGTSSLRRQEAILALRNDLGFIDIRGAIEQRIALLDTLPGLYGVVIAKAALIRLNLLHLNYIDLEGETAENQGKLAIVARKGRGEIKKLFTKSLYLGLESSHFAASFPSEKIVYCPLIETRGLSPSLPLEGVTHIIVTSKEVVRYLSEVVDFKLYKFIAIGKATAEVLKGQDVLVAKESTQEGVIELLKQMDFAPEDRILYPKSSLARPSLALFLRQLGVDYRVVDLYETRGKKGVTLPPLEAFEQIIFSSPSVVEAFFALSPKKFDSKNFYCIGPVTQKKMDEQLKLWYNLLLN